MEITFKPTPAMYRTRANLHRSCSADQAVSLTPAHPNFVNYIRPTPMLQIRKWLENYGEEFWEWLITPPESDGKELEARELAYATILEIMNLENKSPITGFVDPQILKAKLDAAKLLLGSRGPMIAIQNNNGGEEVTPLGLRAKSPHQIEQRLHQITKHIPDDHLLTMDAEVEQGGR